MPSAKKAFSFSMLKLSNGNTAMLFSGIASAIDGVVAVSAFREAR
jgi:hypothetical protein